MKEILWIFMILIMLEVVSASFTKGNGTAIEASYGPGENLRGWLNISLKNEETSSLLSAFESKIKILDFLTNNDLEAGEDFICIPSDCNTDYDDSEKELSKTFSLAEGERKLIGLKLQGYVEEELSSFSFSMNVSSDAQESSNPQLLINILDDEDIEWQPYTGSGNFSAQNYSCFESDDAEGQAELIQTEYCEKITLSSSPNIKVGADVSKVSGSANFEFNIYTDEQEHLASCSASATASGKISCVVDLKVDEEKDFFVCINAKTSIDENKYTIAYEQNEPCGFSGEYEEYDYDFAIFAQAGKYASLRSFILNDDELEAAGSSVTDLASYIGEYIDERYENNCTNDCIVPIEFVSNANQEITLSNSRLSYSAGISKTTNDLYELEEKPALINMGFKKLDLEKSNLTVPASYGNKTLVLSLGSTNILTKTITIVKAPIINYVVPLNLPAGLPVKFIVSASGNATEYKWNFGDLSEETTTTNSVYHTYNDTGTYELKITASNNIGSSAKTFSVSVRSPEEEINETLAAKKSKLNALKGNLSKITEWYKGELEKQINSSDLETELRNIERRYQDASSDEYVEIMLDLQEIKIPSLSIIEEKGGYLPDVEIIKPFYLAEISGEEVDDPDKYKDAIISWIIEYLDLNIEGKTYYADYEGRKENILSVFALRITPKKEFIRDSYLIIDKNYDGLKFKENYNEKVVGEAVGITFSELTQGQEKIIEFASPEKMEVISLPVYISPEFSQLPNVVAPGPCDNDNVCEGEIGETEENCINDCATWWTKWKGKIILLIILLICAFIAYIALQEWYKRYYEKRLFVNKNDLFNLVCFMDNALNQLLDKATIAKKLKDYGWEGEQIAHALKKAQGKRTGMWEIPIFRIFEKRKIKKEIEKRRPFGVKMPTPTRYPSALYINKPF